MMTTPMTAASAVARRAMTTSEGAFAERTIPTPIGAIRLLADDQALRGVYLPEHRWPGPAATEHALPHPILDAAAAQLREYFQGRRRAFDVPTSAAGTDFQRAVWVRLAEIPFGTCISYGELARRLGRPAAARAVGAANGQNPLSIFVPCHRVTGANGSLTGYAGGLTAKRWLLEHEARLSRGAIRR